MSASTPSNLLVLRITPDAARYRTGAQTNDYYRRVLTSLREVPAIAVRGGGHVAADEHDRLRIHAAVLARARPPRRQRDPEASIRMATPGYFGTLGLPLIAGREFTDGDDADAPRVVIINQKLATSAWGNENPVGRNLVLDYQRGPYPYEVVGVVRDDRHDGPRSEPVPEIYIPHAQNPYLVMNVIARTTLDPMAVAQTARANALRVDPDQPVHSVTTMEQLLGDAVQLDRFAMLLITLFAVGGLITAAGGVYALLAYTVVQRRREIALRMALGASPRRVARSIVMESLVLAVAGGTIGMVGAAASSRFARTMLFGVAPQDPVTLVTAVAVLLRRGRGRQLAAGAACLADRPVARDEDLIEAGHGVCCRAGHDIPIDRQHLCIRCDRRRMLARASGHRAHLTSPSAVTPGEPGGGGVSRPALVGFPARTDTVDFRTQLENKYVSMGRRPAPTIVDMEGEATWVGEYSRYRVNGCDHDTATQRALAQVDGAAPGQVCSILQFPETAIYPPRDHVVDFRRQLGAKYQSLGRSCAIGGGC